MARPPQTFLARLKDLEATFTTEEAERLFTDLQPASVRVYLSHAVKAGLLEQVGLKHFRHAKRPEKGRPLTPLTAKVVHRLRSELMPSDFEQLIVWNDDALAPFAHDAFPEPFVVVEGSKDAVQAAERVLQPNFPTEVVRGRQNLGQRVWSRHDVKGPVPQVFLSETSSLHATRPSAHGFQSPTVGRLFIHVLQMPAMLPDAATEMMRSPEFKLKDALDAAPSKTSAAKVGAFLFWTLSNHPDHPIRPQVEEILPTAIGAR